MISILQETPMILFRFKSYKHHDFISSHNEVCKLNGSAWMMKAGKRTSIEKINNVLKKGGWMILRSPKSEGSKSYLAHFSEFSEEIPSDSNYPAYYQEILEEENDEVFSMYNDYQWFHLTQICSLPEKYIPEIVLTNTQKPIDKIIGTTRTAVMFVNNRIAININE